MTDVLSSKLPHSHFDTGVLPPEAQFEAWREAISVMFDARSAGGDANGFQAQVDAYLLGEAGLGMISAQAQHYDRSRSKLGRDGIDSYVLQYYLDGSCGRRDGGGDSATRPGDLFIVDAAQALSTSTSDSRFLSLVVPRRLLAPLLHAPDELSMRVMSGKAPLIALLRDHLSALYRTAGQLDNAQAQAVIPGTLQLAAAAINGEASESNAGAVTQSLFSSICRYLDSEMTNLTLTPQGVASHFGISRATLYRLFEPVGGFFNYLRQQRLRQCHGILSDRSQQHRSIAEIAQSYGFLDASNFTRAYRKATGMSPRETRALALEGHANPALSIQVHDWRAWLSQMR
jgi:AraC-like DNA-binding protein